MLLTCVVVYTILQHSLFCYTFVPHLNLNIEELARTFTQLLFSTSLFGFVENKHFGLEDKRFLVDTANHARLTQNLQPVSLYVLTIKLIVYCLCRRKELNKQILNKLEITQKVMERVTIGLTTRDKKRNENTRRRTRVTNTIERVMTLKCNFFRSCGQR